MASTTRHVASMNATSSFENGAVSLPTQASGSSVQRQRSRAPVRTRSDRSLHRTHSGGVNITYNGSPMPRRSSTRRKQSSSVNKRSTTTVDPHNVEMDNEETDEESMRNTQQARARPTALKKSAEPAIDDSEDEIRTDRSNILLNHKGSSRADVLEHFIYDDNGFKCKICDQVGVEGGQFIRVLTKACSDIFEISLCILAMIMSIT
jgi:hypothetical protein